MAMKKYPLYQVDYCTNLRDLVRNAVRKHAAKTAFAWFDRAGVIRKKTFEQFSQDVNSLGTALYDLGFTPEIGKHETLPPRIAVIGENSYDWLVTYFAVTNGGNVIVPLDRDLPKDSLQHILEESGASAVVYSDSYAEIFEDFKAHKRVKTLKTFVNMKSELPAMIIRGGKSLAGGNTAYLEATINETATTAIIFTSGTTGLSKGVELSHLGLTHNVVNGHRLISLSGPTVLVLPLHHTYGFGASIISTFLLGCMCFINDSLKNVPRDIKATKPEFICVVPLFVESFYKKIMANIREQGKEKMVEQMSGAINFVRKAGIDLRRVAFKKILDAFGGNLKVLISGGAALNAELVNKFNDFGITIIEGYGITECSPIVSLNRNKWWKAGSVGQLVPGVEVRIAEPNSDGNGEICVKGPIVMNGYYKKPELTASVMEKGGWLRTGDIGHFDSDKFLYITGRKKNLIILANGKNIHPEELEDMIIRREEVSEVVVRESGKDIMAEIYPNYEFEGFAGLDRKKINHLIEKVIKDVNTDLPIYKRIKKIEIRDVEFEKTTTKKIKRW